MTAEHAMWLSLVAVGAMAGKGHGFVTHQLRFLLGCRFLPEVNPVAAVSALVWAGPER